MKTFTANELAEVLKKHEMWLNDEEGGERANLRGANLRGANLDFSCLPLWCGALEVFERMDKNDGVD